MKIFSNLFFALFLTFLFGTSVFAVQEYNKEGDFSVRVESQQVKVFNDDIEAHFDLEITNRLSGVQVIDFTVPKTSGWDIKMSPKQLVLDAKETQSVRFSFIANSNFDYSTKVVSPDLVKISQNEGYIGDFDFPVSITGRDEDVSLTFAVSILDRELTPVIFLPRLSSEALSPQKAMSFTISGENVLAKQTVEVKVLLNDTEIYNFHDVFTSDNVYHIYNEEFPNTIAPGTYEGSIVVRLLLEGGRSAQEWFDMRNLVVLPYEYLDVESSFNSGIVRDSGSFLLFNSGNVPTQYSEVLEMNSLKKQLFSSNAEYEVVSGGIEFTETLEPGEEFLISYSINYIPLYLLLIVLLTLVAYIYVRKTSNPLDVELKLYDIKKVQHEGVKSFKARIGFENIKEEEIDTLTVVFRMPSYLKVEDNSFLLAPPKHALKGRSQYKLVWEFKRFEINDSRILGFTLMNTRGVLGDIRLPQVEFEVKVNGRVRKYYEAFPIIRG